MITRGGGVYQRVKGVGVWYGFVHISILSIGYVLVGILLSRRYPLTHTPIPLAAGVCRYAFELACEEADRYVGMLFR